MDNAKITKKAKKKISSLKNNIIGKGWHYFLGRGVAGLNWTYFWLRPYGLWPLMALCKKCKKIFS